MAKAVVAGSMAKCTMALPPGTCNLVATPSKVKIGGKGAMTIKASAPNMNVPSFGMCQSLANPTVAAATTAALGVLTPQPCIPSLPGNPWIGCMTKVKVGGAPCLTTDGTLTCIYGGSISITSAGQGKVGV